MKKYYMHTLDGKPAFFSDKEGICFASNPKGAWRFNFLATSLKQIKDEQDRDRDICGNHIYDIYEHGYIVVYAP